MHASRPVVLTLGTILLVCISLRATAADKESIIWECGHNVPNSAYWRMYSAELEQRLPFDGVMLKIQYPVAERGSMQISEGRKAWTILTKETITKEMLQPFVEDMRAAGLKKLTHNMISVGLRGSRQYMDYFDDEWWKIICDNIRIVAEAAKDAGCDGLVFDPEQYGGDYSLNYHDLAVHSADKPFDEYVAKVRQRGQEFGKALSEGYPNCKLLFLHGYSISVHSLKQAITQGTAKSLEDLGTLYPALLDGMLEGTSDGTLFIDGMELAYSYTTVEDFKKGRWLALHGPLTITAVPELFRKKARCGFGLWTDNCNETHWWNPFDPELNLYSPGRLQRTIHLALTHGDGYVWLWNEKVNWYVDGPKGKPHPPVEQKSAAYGMPKIYRDAVRAAKEWPGLDTTLPRTFQLADAETLGFIDGDQLEQLITKTEQVMELPSDGWSFRPDRDLIGVKEGWYREELSTERWESDFPIGQWWERAKDGKYSGLDGVAWYRRQIKFSEVPENRRLYLHFGAVDETLHLWIDGRYAGVYGRTPNHGWDKPFAIEVTGRITNDAHTLAIRARDVFAMGGIWKKVTLIAEP